MINEIKYIHYLQVVQHVYTYLSCIRASNKRSSPYISISHVYMYNYIQIYQNGDMKCE